MNNHRKNIRRFGLRDRRLLALHGKVALSICADVRRARIARSKPVTTKRYPSFESMLPVIEYKWRLITRGTFDECEYLWNDMLQESYIRCWQAWESGQLGQDDRYLTVIIKRTCYGVVRQDKALRGMGKKHGSKITVFEYAVSDIASDQDDEFGDSWLDRQVAPEATEWPETRQIENIGDLSSEGLAGVLKRALESLAPLWQERVIRLLPFWTSDSATATELVRYSGLSRHDINNTRIRLKAALERELSSTR